MPTHATFEHTQRERRETIRVKNFLQLLISISRVVQLITTLVFTFPFFSFPVSKLSKVQGNSNNAFRSRPRSILVTDRVTPLEMSVRKLFEKLVYARSPHHPCINYSNRVCYRGNFPARTLHEREKCSFRERKRESVRARVRVRVSITRVFFLIVSII